MQHSSADKTEILASNVSSSHIAMETVAAETVVMPTTHNHLTHSGRSVDSICTLNDLCLC